MSMKFRVGFVFMLSGLVAVFVLFNGVGAQEIDKERAIDILQTQGGPGGCTDEASCSAFCENPDNFQTCVSWARQNGLISGDEAERAEKFARQGRQFSGPGGCTSPEQCKDFCEQPQNHEACIDFAVSQGFMTQEEANRIKEFRREGERFRDETERERERFEQEFEVDPEFDKDRALEIVESQGGPGGCSSMEECEVFCENPQNQEVCFEFAEKHNLFKNRGHAEKIKKILKEGGPGGCRGERECRQFCENPDNFETCLNFAKQNEFIPAEQVEKARRGIQALKEGGPGGCQTPKECQQICQKPENQDACFQWAKKHGLMSEEELRRIEEFKKRGEELRGEFERRGEEFKPPEGFHPPGFGGTPPPEHSPGPIPAICPMMPTVDSCPPGYRKEVAFSSPECGTYYTCVPEGGYTAPAYTESPQPTHSPSPDPASECSQKGGTWNAETRTCMFERHESILQQTGAYILKAFIDFFR